MSIDEMLACPFCGGLPNLRYIRDGYQMYCMKCGASAGPQYHGPNRDTIPRAKVAWNTRLSASLLDGLGQTKSADCGNSNKQSAQGLSRATGGDA